MAYSSDGKYIVTGSGPPCGARVSDAATGKLVHLLPGLTHCVSHAAFSDDGRILATAHDFPSFAEPPGEAKVWDIAVGKELLSLPFKSPVRCMALSPDGQRLYLDVREDEKNDFRVYSVADGKRLPSPVPPPTAGPFALSRDGQRLAMYDWSVNFDRLMICNALTGEKLVHCSMQGLVGSVFQLAFSPDGRRLAARCGWEAVVWDASTGKRLYAVKHGPDLQYLAFSPDGKTLALAIKSNVKMTDAETGHELYTLRTGYTREVTGIAFHPDGDRLATSGIPGEEVKVWEVGDREVRTIAHEPFDLAENSHEPDNLVFSPDGRTCASIAREGPNNIPGPVKLLDLVGGRELGSIPREQPDGRFVRLACRPDGHLLALCLTGAKEGKAHGLEVRDLTAGRKLFTVREQGLAAFQEGAFHRLAAFSADGSRLAVAATDGDQDVKLWDVARGEVICPCRPGPTRVGE